MSLSRTDPQLIVLVFEQSIIYRVMRTKSSMSKQSICQAKLDRNVVVTKFIVYVLNIYSTVLF